MTLTMSESTELKQLELLGFLPMTGKGWVGGAACLPAVWMALRHVNDRRRLLDGYNLTYSWVDSQVNIFANYLQFSAIANNNKRILYCR